MIESPTLRMLAISKRMVERGFGFAARDFPERFPFYNEYQLKQMERAWGLRR